MSLSRTHKLLLLFLSSKNPLWDGIYGAGHARGDTFHKKIIAKGSLANIRKGVLPEPGMPSEIFRRTLNEIVERVKDDKARTDLETRLNEFRKSFLHDVDDLRVYPAANKLKIDRADTQQAIDEAIYNRLSVFPALLYDNADRSRQTAAESDLREYRGLYHIWVKRMHPTRGLLWLQAVLQVRYLIKVAGGTALRCKLNFPIISGAQYRQSPGADSEVSEKHSFDYDGFLAVRDDHLYWVFEKRSNVRRDYFFVITSIGRKDAENTWACHGKYLTVGQTMPQSIVSDDVVLESVTLPTGSKEKLEQYVVAFMRTAKVLTKTESKHAERILKNGVRHEGI